MSTKIASNELAEIESLVGWLSENMIFYADVEHEINFKKMMDLYDLSLGQNAEYESAIYVAAHPEIFKCYDLDKLNTNYGPLGCLLFEVEESVHHNAGALTGTSRALAEAGLSLFNGHQVSVADIVTRGEEMLGVFMQACNIRAGNHF
ncbi:hypothetical protein bcgnr5371_60130 [Bacillus cereus]|uniref:hypothetical protein n=1 Tax=Bacillus sp. BML-BC051 TaxID=2842486 RepID=UPI001C81D6B3|nr:hypothetical protein [Bacillus sp. BML-BC051]BCD33082.1 hypothetical protein BC30102_p113 [Bacillus cereus]HDR6313184.1 hypothetical protein [Bacillus cereus]